MRILLTNDDGIYAPGIRALERELRQIAEVTVVSPLVEQSGVGHSITFLSPLVAREEFDGDVRRGWAVEGSPADCVKLGLFEFCAGRPDLVVSGINGGLNAGINVLYSGTVAAAIEGAFFGLTSVAVSLEYSEHAKFDSAALLARRAIEQIVERKDDGHQPAEPQLFNLNIPTAALEPGGSRDVHVVPMGLDRYGESYEKRIDPRGRAYYWATNDPPPRPSEHETDLTALSKGYVTLTPLHFDLTKHERLERMRSWKLKV
ncbi:MAG: 5'/3'-nucleotidase SurE [Planctomycetia bacterium]|nr:5'/3'-nucleotidase SurE [Planctomycetia bacterium]